MGKQNRTVVASHQSVMAYSGPIPPPESLEKYNDIVPGAAERIIGMAEKEQVHRHTIEERQTKDRKTLMVLSVIGSAFVAILLVCAIIYAIYKGANAYQVALMIGAVGLVIKWISLNREKQ